MSTATEPSTPEELYNHDQYESVAETSLYAAPFFDPEVEFTDCCNFLESNAHEIEVRAYYEDSNADIRFVALFHRGNPFMYGTVGNDFTHPNRYITNPDIFVDLASKMKAYTIRDSIEDSIADPLQAGQYINSIMLSAKALSRKSSFRPS
jgi:hypothetical protein